MCEGGEIAVEVVPYRDFFAKARFSASALSAATHSASLNPGHHRYQTRQPPYFASDLVVGKGQPPLGVARLDSRATTSIGNVWVNTGEPTGLGPRSPRFILQPASLTIMCDDVTASQNVGPCLGHATVSATRPARGDSIPGTYPGCLTTHTT